MYTLLTKIENIKASSFRIDKKNNYLYINKDNSVFLFDGLNLKIAFESTSKLMVSLIYEDEIWIANLSDGNTKIYKSRIIIKEVDFITTINREIDNFLANNNIVTQTYFNGNFSQKYYTKINLIDKSIIKKYDKLGFNGIYQVLNDDLFLSQNNKKIGLFDFENNLIWQHTYSDLLGLENPDIIGLYSDIIKIEDSIYLYLAGRDKNNDNQGTFCIDTETGKTKHIYKNIISFSYPEGDLLYNLHNNKLNILNTITQEIETIDFSEELKKYNIETDSKFAVQNGLIYFSQSMGDIVSKIGILSPKEKKLLWKYEFPKGSGQVGNLQVQGNRIYAHTQDKTLHIFEKTQNETV